MLQTELQTLDDLEDNFILRHGAFAHYREVVKKLLKQAKNGHIYADTPEANDLRNLIKSVTMVPNDGDNEVLANVEVKCRLRPLSHLAPSSGDLMVAEVRYQVASVADYPHFLLTVPLLRLG